MTRWGIALSRTGDVVVRLARIEAHQASGDWDAATAAMVEAARNIERAGAECMLICTNTMHKMAPEVQAAIDVPLIHIADATASAIAVARRRCGGDAVHDGAGLLHRRATQ